MWFHPYIKCFDLFISHPVNIIGAFFSGTHISSIGLRRNVFTKPGFMREYYLLVFCDHYVQFQCGNTHAKCMYHSRDRILRHESATTTMSLLIKTCLHGFLGFLADMTSCKKTKNKQQVL